MEKFAFRYIMNNDIIQKTIIFADAFNLKIESWSPVNTKEHPYRVNFYSNNLLVGYVDIQIYDVGSARYTKSDIPFTLFTPLGKLEGTYYTYQDIFDYIIKNRQDAFEEISGLFKVEGLSKTQNDFYHFALHLILTDSDGERIRMSFNRGASNYEVELEKSSRTRSENIMLYINSDHISIGHINYPAPNFREDLTKITLDIEKRTPTHIGTFMFANKESYQKAFEVLPNEHGIYPNWWQTLTYLKYSDISSEIEENDPRMLEFIDEIKSSLTLPANGITPVNIYDKLSSICFAKDIFKFAFTRANRTPTAIETNPILIRMRNFKKNE